MPLSHDNSPKKELATNQNVAQNARTIGITTLSSDPLKIGVEDSRLFPTLTRTYFRHAMPPLQLLTIFDFKHFCSLTYCGNKNPV